VRGTLWMRGNLINYRVTANAVAHVQEVTLSVAHSISWARRSYAERAHHPAPQLVVLSWGLVPYNARIS